jgi:hypothetical protein
MTVIAKKLGRPRKCGEESPLLKNDVQAVEESNQKQWYICEISGKHLQSIKTLAIHRDIHFARKYSCDLCKRAFHFKDTIRRHMISQLGYRVYQCEHCVKVLKLRSTLQAHINVVHL